MRVRDMAGRMESRLMSGTDGPNSEPASADSERLARWRLTIPLRYFFGAVLVVGVALLDLFIKRMVAGSFRLWESVEIIPGFFSLTYILNPGAAFGLFSTWDSSIRMPFLLGVGVLALGFIAYLYVSPLGSRTLPGVGLPLVAGGALANLYERATAGAVVDYLDFYIKGHHWPAFNVADASITVGVALILLDSFFEGASVNPTPARTADKAASEKPNRQL